MSDGYYSPTDVITSKYTSLITVIGNQRCSVYVAFNLEVWLEVLVLKEQTALKSIILS